MKLRKPWRLLLLATLGAFGAGIVGLTIAYVVVAGSLPKVDTLSDYRPPIITRILGDDGTLIAEYYRERRIVVPVAAMPEKLVQAFVAAEDSNFFQHQGIDLVSILRAALKNIRAGGIVQGGSTITQQVAKSFFLSPERSFTRKFKEAILAWRMEKRLEKEGILFLYLNQIFLGHGAYGVQAAAENYFAKDVGQLTLAECAILAGLPQAPSRYSPYRHFDKAKARQKYVLGRMVEEGYITPEEAEAAFAEAVTVHARESNFIEGTGYFTEQVRRYLEESYGEEALYTGGLQVYTTMNAGMQRAAQDAVRDNLQDFDHRHGYRGPERVLSPEEVEPFLAAQAADIPGPPPPGTTVDGVLSGSATKEGALTLKLRVAALSGELTLPRDHWAAPLQVVKAGEPFVAAERGRAGRLPLGSVLRAKVVEVRPDGTLLFALDQKVAVQGALVALDPATGQVKAMVGGYSFLESQFNRAIQARRLPGSAFKPIIYASALDKGYTPASIILDTPLIYKDKTEGGEEMEWKPKNYEKEWYGPTTFRDGLTRSRNIITIKVLEDIGVGYAANYAQKLGIQSPITRDLTMALGSSAVTPLELSTVYAVFANGGVRVTPTYIAKVVDRDGRVLESLDAADFPGGPGAGQKLIRQVSLRVISPETAYLITNLMESVVRHGTGWRAKSLGRPVAAKTGTTNDLKDAWFAGFVPQLVTVSWVGYDQERPLGEHETGSKAAAPAWVSFMEKALAGLPPVDFPVPDGIEFRPVDPATGLLVTEDSDNPHIEVFAPGTAPTRYVMDEQRLEARDFFKMDF